MITYGVGGGMPFFFADRKVFCAREYLAGVGMPLIRQVAHKVSDLNGSGDVNFGSTCRSLMALDVTVSLCPTAQLARIPLMI